MKKGNMYEFVDIKWNPLSGECLHKCQYCSTESFKRYPGCKAKYSGLPRIDEKQINKNLGKDKFVFVVSQNDLFAKNVDLSIITEIISKTLLYDNTYLFQTKNPSRLLDVINKIPIPKKSIFCFTLESNRYFFDKMGTAPTPFERFESIVEFKKSYPWFEIQLTVEPVMDFDLDYFYDIIKEIAPTQVNIGADSKRNKLPEPSKEKVLQLIDKLSLITKVVIKSNLFRVIK